MNPKNLFQAVINLLWSEENELMFMYKIVTTKLTVFQKHQLKP